MVEKVVTDESNPTGEDTSLDNAINELYEKSTESETSTPESEPTETEVPDESEETEDEGDVDRSDEDDSGSEDVAEDVAEDEEAFKLPENMPKELREKLESLDEDVQKASTEVFKQMHKNYTKKNQDLSKQNFLAESVTEAFRKNGINVDNVKKQSQIISNYVAFDKLLQTDPVRAVKLIAERHNINLSPTKTEQEGSSDLDDELLTDSEKIIIRKLEAANEEIRRLKQDFNNKESQEQLTAVQRFAQATDENGELKHPHFDKVKEDMMDLADVNPNMTIDQLYKKAVRMNDDLYEETLKAERQRVIDENKRKKDERLQKAKAMSRQSLKQNSSQTQETLDEDAMFEKIAIESGFN